MAHFVDTECIWHRLWITSLMRISFYFSSFEVEQILCCTFTPMLLAKWKNCFINICFPLSKIKSVQHWSNIASGIEKNHHLWSMWASAWRSYLSFFPPTHQQRWVFIMCGAYGIKDFHISILLRVHSSDSQNALQMGENLCYVGGFASLTQSSGHSFASTYLFHQNVFAQLIVPFLGTICWIWRIGFVTTVP